MFLAFPSSPKLRPSVKLYDMWVYDPSFTEIVNEVIDKHHATRIRDILKDLKSL